ncbi:MAG: hypothetical protein H7336_10105 [Bacteriovorax sp.]|nr:hypothetical protein [Bacteriovorax sp.]
MDDKAKTGLESLEEIEERLKEIKDRTSKFVKEHPLTSIAIAAGIGYLVAKLFSGRRK